MRTKILLYSLACLFLVSCGEDRRPEYAARTAADRWIEKTMTQNYYWYEDIKKPAKGFNYFTEPVDFFKSLLSSKDKFSYIESFRVEEETRSISQVEYSYGFDFEAYKNPESENSGLLIRILYTVENSPAQEAGLSRGDWILAIEDEEITQENVRLLYGDRATQLTIGVYDETAEGIVADRTVEIGNARPVLDYPIHYSSVLATEKGNVGYMVYTHFDSRYNQDLLEWSNLMKAANPTELILDLRYNPGGTVSTAQILSTILAPTTALGKLMGFMEFNDRFDPRDEELYFTEELLNGGSNLNLKRLYVLTTQWTASASELLMYCLSPYMEVIVIGETTVGKNVGSITYSNDEEQLVMHPIVCKIYNSEGLSDYSNGIRPQYTLSESSNFSRSSLPLGNPDELLLYAALSLILDEEIPEEPEARSIGTTPVLSSMEKKAIPAVLLDSSFARESPEVWN